MSSTAREKVRPWPAGVALAGVVALGGVIRWAFTSLPADDSAAPRAHAAPGGALAGGLRSASWDLTAPPAHTPSSAPRRESAAQSADPPAVCVPWNGLDVGVLSR